MPTYEYQCTACKKRFEQYQSIKDKSLKKCPSCGKNALERLIGIGAAVIFKGSGFYQTDYRSESYRKDAAADTKAAEPVAPPAKSDAKDTTPAATPAPAATESGSKSSSSSEASPTAKTTQAKRRSQPSKPVAKAAKTAKKKTSR
jgi:putative FmdB family regulatory protein